MFVCASLLLAAEWCVACLMFAATLLLASAACRSLFLLVFQWIFFLLILCFQYHRLFYVCLSVCGCCLSGSVCVCVSCVCFWCLVRPVRGRFVGQGGRGGRGVEDWRPYAMLNGLRATITYCIGTKAESMWKNVSDRQCCCCFLVCFFFLFSLSLFVSPWFLHVFCEHCARCASCIYISKCGAMIYWALNYTQRKYGTETYQKSMEDKKKTPTTILWCGMELLFFFFFLLR